MAESILLKSTSPSGWGSQAVQLYMYYSYAQNTATDLSISLFIKTTKSSYPIGPWTDWGNSYIKVNNTKQTFKNGVPSGTSAAGHYIVQDLTFRGLSGTSFTVEYYWDVNPCSGGFITDSWWNRPSGTVTITVPEINTEPSTPPSTDLPAVTQTPKVKSVAYEQDADVGFTIYVETDYFDINKATLLIPTWTSALGQGTNGALVKWYWAQKGTHSYDNKTYQFKYKVPFSDHSNLINTTYHTHFYWTRTTTHEGACANMSASSFAPDTAKPVISNTWIVQRNSDIYDVYIKTDNTVKRISLATWTDADSQDDLLWTANVVKETNTIGNVEYNWRGSVNRLDHKDENGVYITHPYAYNGYGSSASAASLTLANKTLASPKNCFVKLNNETRAIDYGFTWPTLTNYSPAIDRVDVYLNHSDSPILPATNDPGWTLLSSVKESDLDTNKRYLSSFSQGVQIERLAGKYIFVKLRAYPTLRYNSDVFSSAIVFTYEYIPNGQEKDIIKIKNQNDFISGLVKYKLADGSWQPCITKFK